MTQAFTRRIFATTLLLGSLTLLSACPDTPIQPDGTSAATATETPASFSKISSQEEAHYADIAVGPDGVLHALFQERSKVSSREQVYYRASSDSGASWSETQNLLEGDSESNAGFIRIAVDGQGRVYAFWKPYKGFDIVSPSGGSIGSLNYRVLSGGSWSAPITVGTPSQLVSWFPAKGPDGSMQIVWSETQQRGGGSYSSDWQAGLVRQARLEGETVQAVRDLITSPFHDANSDGYMGLSGYIDASGQLHFTALKSVASSGSTEPVEIVYYDGSERTLMPSKPLEAVLKSNRHHPPQLLRDAQGREHLLVLNQGLDQAALQDYDPARLDAPVVLAQLKSDKGDIRGFQAVQGADGKLAALLSMHDTGKADAKHDLYVLRFNGQSWQTPFNLTENAARENFVNTPTSTATSFSKLVVYSSKNAAGVFSGDKLNLLFVNTEITSLMRESTLSDGSTDWAGASNSTSNVYFYGL